MKKKGPSGHLVEVIWYDACSTHGWYADSELHKCRTSEMKTVGYLVRRNSHEILLAQTRSEHGEWSEVWAIPSKTVKRIRRK